MVPYKDIFNALISKLRVTPDIDLFASTLNYQAKPYVAYTAYPEAYAIKAFHIPLEICRFYAFPHFCINNFFKN